MTVEMQEALDREMNDALALDDEARRRDALLTVLAHQNAALVDCQRKTADRVKRLVSDVDGMKTDLASCVESDREYRRAKEQAKGAIWSSRLLVAAGSVVGYETLVMILKKILAT